jgi:hypothetical protein
MSAQDPREWMQDPATLTEEIDATREDAGQTLHALQEKLSPGQLFDQSLTYLTERGYELACGIGRAAREHPVPFALAAAGTLWYLSRRRSDEELEITLDEELEDEALAGIEGMEGGDEYARYSGGYAGEQGESATHRAAQRARAAATHATEAVGRATEVVGRGTRRAKSEFSRVLQEQPLLVGAIGLAIGAAIASLVPVTDREERLLGEKSERLVRRAKDKANEQVDKAREKARRVTEAARGALSESDRTSGTPSGNGSSGVQGSPSGPSMQPNP